MRKRLIVSVLVALTVSVPLAVAAQRGGGFFGGGRSNGYPNVEYDGQFTFARIRYRAMLGRRGGGGWAADYPLMEQNLTAMMAELTSVAPHTDGSNVHDLNDPELLKYPVAYLSEPGYWYPSEEEVKGLQEFLAKGGFLIVDDFHFANEWAVFENAMRRVLPNALIERLDVSHPVFNSFFNIKTLHVPYPGETDLFGEFYGIHEDNDSTKRLSVVINYNMDVGDYVEWAQSSRSYSFEPTNEAYKFMINYVIYGLSH